MKIKPIQNYFTDERPLLFKSQLKNLYKKGKLPIKYGLYGEILTKDNVSDEHIICKCLGGTNDISNIALASKELNNARGNQPIGLFVTMGMLRKYLLQFKNLKLKNFDGNEYIKGIRQTFRRLVDDDNIL